MTPFHWNIATVCFAITSFLIQVGHLLRSKNPDKWLSWRGWAIIIFAVFMGLSSIFAIKTSNSEETTKDSINTANHNSLVINLNNQRDSISLLGKDIKDIKKALKDANLGYDSIDNKIININTSNVRDNSGINMPNAQFHGNPQIGPKNTQNNYEHN